MENLSDPPRGGTPHSGGQLGPGAGPPPGPPQLPPQMFTTAAQLLDLTDSKVLPPCQPNSITTRHHLTDSIVEASWFNLALLCASESEEKSSTYGT